MQVLRLKRFCKACVGQFACQERYRKPLSPLWLSCESYSHQFECQKLFRKHFSPLWRSFEALLHLFVSQEGLFVF